jgi:RNA polymerase sigma factor (sigma-70 family)
VGRGPVEGWVWRCVVNRARKARRVEPQQPVSDVTANGDGTADPAAVRRHVGALPERQRLAVFLRYYADLDYRQIAGVLGVEVGTVSATLSAAHAALRKELQEVVG